MKLCAPCFETSAQERPFLSVGSRGCRQGRARLIFSLVLLLFARDALGMGGSQYGGAGTVWDPALDLLVLAVIFFVGATVQGVVGFGFGMISMSTLPFFLDFRFAVPLVAVFSLMAHLFMMRSLWPSLSFSRVAPLVAGGVLGMPLGVVFLKSANLDLLKLVLGMVIVFYVVWSMIPQGRRIRDPGRPWALFAGAVGGALGGAMNSSGPPVVIYLTQKPWDNDTIKATLQGFFALMATTQLILYFAADILTSEVLELNMMLTPVILFGVWFGIWASRKVNQELFRKLVLGVLMILGLIFVFRGIWG